MTTTASLEQHQIADLNRLALAVHLGSFRSNLLYWGSVGPGEWRNYLHCHFFTEVCYAFAGWGTFHSQGASRRVQAGDVFVARPGDAHEILSSGHGALGIHFWAHTLERSPIHRADAAPIDGLLDAFLASRTSVCRGGAAIPLTLDLLGDEVDHRASAYRQAIEGLVVKLLIDSCRAVTDAPRLPAWVEEPRRGMAELVGWMIIQYLEDNYDRPIGMRDIAARVHMSERHAGRLFRRVTGTSPIAYLTSLRLDAAARLLLLSDLPIKEIAARCGYPDVQYFTTLFRRHKRLPPARFRARGGALVPSGGGRAGG